MNVPDTFWNVLTPLVVVLTGLSTYALSALERKSAARELRDVVEQKTDTIIHQTDGVNAKLQLALDNKDVQATHLAELTEKDKQIAALTKGKEQQ
jgi:ATP-dependent protease Clp ATPase subunit